MSDDFEDIDDEENEVGEDEPKKKGLPRLVIFGALGGLILILGAAAAFMLLTGGGDDEHAVAEGEHGEASEHGEPAHEGVHYTYYELREIGEDGAPITVNIRSDDGRPMILMLELSQQSADAELTPVLEENLDVIMDSYITFLRELRQDDLYGSSGAHRVRLELLRRINLAIEPAHVDQVLIQSMMISD